MRKLEHTEGSDRTARRVRLGLGALMVVLFLGVIAAGILRPDGLGLAPVGSDSPTESVEPTVTPIDPESAAVKAAIDGFYATVDASKPVTTSPFVFREGRGGPAPAAPATGATVFNIARTVIETDTADVYGRESRSVIATGGAEVEFRLQRIEGEWLISSWQAAPVLVEAPQTLTLTDVTARDIVRTLLQARQVGDATTMRILTTKAFQDAHYSWYDGADRTVLLSAWKIVSDKKAGAAHTVTVKEDWLPQPLTTTYTIVLTDGEIMVDGWSWKVTR